MDFELLRRLSDAPGVSGNERAVREILAETVLGHVDGMHTDTMGNLHVSKAGREHDGFRVLVAAHMDEVGLMVTDADSSGALKFATVGGIDARVLVSQAVRVGPNAVPGVIGIKPVHLSEPEERSKPPRAEQLRIDVGADSRESALGLVKRGDYVTFATTALDLGPTLLGKAFDDRGGCALLADLLDERYPCDLHGVFTVQEEVGLRGARVAAHAVSPHAAIVLECGTTDDMPKERDDTPVMRLGHGPAITVMDRSMAADARLVRHLRAAAEAEGIPYQIRGPVVGGTDAGRIHLARAGVPSAVVSVPCRYLHSPASLIDKTDIQHTARLVRAALHGLNPEVVA